MGYTRRQTIRKSFRGWRGWELGEVYGSSSERQSRRQMPASWSIAALDTIPPKLVPSPAPSWWLSGFMMPGISSAWFNFVACMVFQAVVCLLCVHDGPTMVHRYAKAAPRVLGGLLKRKEDRAPTGGRTTAAHAEVDPALSVAQSWKLGALHERFSRAREDSNLREAGEVLGRPRPLTEEEFLSLGRVSERATQRSRGCCNLADTMFFSGIIGGMFAIGSVLHYVTNPVQALLEEVINLVGATPETLLRLVALAACLALVCEGFRAADDIVRGRIALAGVAGAVLCYSTNLEWTADQSCFSSWCFDQEEHQLLSLLLFSLPLLAFIAVKLDFALAGFLAVMCAFSGVVVSTNVVIEAVGIGGSNSGVVSVAFASLIVDVLFILAIFLGVETRHLQLFASGVMATGVIALHLAMLVNSYPEWDDIGHRVLLQLPVYACLTTGWSLGRAIGSDGLKNNTLFFGALYIAATIISGVWTRFPDSDSLFVGILSLCAWRFGLYLRHDDGFLASLWTLDAALLRDRLLL